MADYSTGALGGFEYGPQRSHYPFSTRQPWPGGYPPDQDDSRSPQEQDHGANANGARRSTTPLPMTASVYDEHLLHPQHTMSLPLPTDDRTFLHSHTTIYSGCQPHQPHYETAGFQRSSLSDQLAAPHYHSASAMGQPPSDFEQNPSAETDWPVLDVTQASVPYTLQTTCPPQFSMHDLNMTYHNSPTEFVASTTPPYDGTFTTSYSSLSDPMTNIPFDWTDLSHDLNNFHSAASQTASIPVPGHSAQHLAAPFPNSPSDSSLEVRSPSSSDNGWNMVERHHFESTNPNPPNSLVFNPSQTLHNRKFSDSSNSDQELGKNRRSWSSYVDIAQHAVGSPGNDEIAEAMGAGHFCGHYHSPVIKQESHHSSPVLSRATAKPIQIDSSKSQRSSVHKSPGSSQRSSPPTRKPPRKNSNRATKPSARKQPSPMKGESEKKVGRRKGPLSLEQRKQASEIRKLGACLRCKYLKKTCDTGDQCEGCQAHHTRLWNLPCVRLDIRDLGFFMKDWKTHFEQNVSLSFSITNIKGHGLEEQTLYITHGYGGHILPVRAREVIVRQEGCFGLEWVEQFDDAAWEHSVDTARLSTGVDGVSMTSLSSYLDKHLESFPDFIDEYFEGTPFVSDMLKTTYRYWTREKHPLIRKVLKMLLAYNLTHHITMLEAIPDEQDFEGRIYDTNSKFYGKIAAPVMINFEVKCAMATMWRDLQKEVLEDLSPLYASIYSKDKFKNWPTIFLTLIVLLAVWEEIQFDYNYRIQDREVVESFCKEMEGVPIKVLVGLFSTVSQRLPSFYEWDTTKHHETLNSNKAVCDVMTDVHDYVTTNDDYLRSRCDTTFDRSDFDSLSGKFMSQLVIRPTTP